MEMPDGNSAAELNNDHAQSKYACSAEYRAAQLTLKDARHSFINNILHNIDVTIGDNTYDLTDVFSGIEATDQLWLKPLKLSVGEVELNYLMSTGDIFDNEPSDAAKLYAAGKLDPQWHTVLEKHVNHLADTVYGELDE